MIKQLMEQKRWFDLYILARFCYRVGQNILTDRQYEFLQSEIKKVNPPGAQDFLNRTYNDDPYPMELIKEFGLEGLIPVQDNNRSELKKMFNEDKSMSINSVTKAEEAYTFYSYYRNCKQDLCHSVKVDGDNTKSLFLKKSDDDEVNEFAISLSRGRDTAESFDYTDRIRFVMPRYLKGVPNEFRLYAEAYVESDYLMVLRKKYPKKEFVTEKSAALSLLRVQYELEDYKHLHLKAFFGEGLAETMQGTFEALEKLGFETPPHFLIKWQEIPETFEEFVPWLDERVFKPLAESQDYLPSDGVVVEVNDLNFSGETTGQYNSRQLALKFGPWDFGHEKGVVTSIIMEQRRVFACTKVTIEPIVTADGSRARVINCFNPSVLISAGIRKGSIVYFERNSGAVNILLHGQRLADLMAEEEVAKDDT